MDSSGIFFRRYAAAAVDTATGGVYYLWQRAVDLLAEYSVPGSNALLELGISDACGTDQGRPAGRGAREHMQPDCDCTVALRRWGGAVRDQYLGEHRGYCAGAIELCYGASDVVA